MSIDWIAFALGFAGTMTVLAGVVWVAGAIHAQVVFDHDNPEIDYGALDGDLTAYIREINRKEAA